jgi:predicted MFS family arabinose efflux permease
VLPPSPRRPVQIDLAGAVLLALGIAGLLVALAQGPAWGWLSPLSVVTGLLSLALLAGWAAVEVRVRHPLVDLRLLRRRPVLAANVTAFLVAIGFYPLGSLVVRYVQTPPGAGYGFGAPVVIAGLMLTPFSLASFAAARVARRLARRGSAELVVAGSCVLLITSLVLFGLARSSYWQIVLAMALDGFGVGCVYAVNPLQITGGVPAHETGSAISFYQLARTVAYAIGSALSATMLSLSIPSGQSYPTYVGYGAAAAVCAGVLVVALLASGMFAIRGSPAAQQPQQVPAN